MIKFIMLWLSAFILSLVFMDSVVPLQLDYISANDKKGLLSAFDNVLTKDTTDIKIWHYSLISYYAMGELQKKRYPLPIDACKLSNDVLKASGKPLDTYFHASSCIMLLNIGGTDCKISDKANAQKIAQESLLKKGVSSEEMYYGVSILRNLALPVDSLKVVAVLKEIAKKDSNVVTQSYIFHTVGLLELKKPDIKSHFDDIDDVVQQADEISGKVTYYEQGLFTTSFIVTGIGKVAAKYGEIPKIPANKLVMLTNYLLSRRYTRQPRAVAYLLLALSALESNSFLTPISVSLSESSKSGIKPLDMLNINAVSLFENPIEATVNLVDLKLNDKSVAVKKTPFKLVNKEYQLKLADCLVKVPKDGLEYGLYKVVVNVISQKKGQQFIGTETLEIPLKVVTVIKVNNARIEIVDRDDASHMQSSLISQLGDKHKEKILKAEQNQIVSVYFSLGKPSITNPHQTFLRLRHAKTDNEIIFVAQPVKRPDVNAAVVEYKANFDLTNNAKEFAYTSGLYNIQVIIGDTLYVNGGAAWYMGDIELTFGAAPPKNPFVGSQKVHFADAPKMKGDEKPEIQHLFRVPEKRAPSFIAYSFAILVIVPFFVMLILWIPLGVNIKGLAETSIYGILFHVCIGVIFGIYFMYWLKWNMFLTMKYLAFMTIPTFLIGHKMLHSIASYRLKSTNKPKTE